MSPAAPALPGVLRRGLLRGLATVWLLARIMIPVSACVAALQWSGALARVGGALAPAMGLFGLPGETAVALVTGACVGVYGAIAAASPVALTATQMTVLALMVLTAHNLIVESAVQGRSGASGPRMAALRVAAAVALGALLWQVLRHGDPGPLVTGGAADGGSAASGPLGAFAAAWAAGAAALLLKIFLILAALNVATEAMRAYGLFDLVGRRLGPVMRFLGLSDRVAFLWLTASVLGLAFGAGLLVDEAGERDRYSPSDLRDLHVSIAISHSLLEDTILFLAVGAHPFWIVAPRPLAAAVAVRAARRLDRAAARSDL